MASNQCKEFCQNFLNAMGAVKTDVVAEYLAEDVRWWFPKSGASQGVDHCVEGREAVLAILGHGDTYFKHLAFTAERVVEDGEMVAVHATADGETHGGNRYENEYIFLFRIVDGAIAEGWEFVDTAYVFSVNH